MRRLACFVLCLAATGARAGEAPERLTLDDAVRLALASHPSVSVARQGIAVAAARRRQALSLFFPSLTGALGYLPQTANFAGTPQFQRAFATGGLSIGVTCRPGQPGCSEPQPCVLATDPATGQALTPGCVATSVRGGPTAEMFSYWTANLGLQWTLFDFGRSYYGWRSAGETLTAAEEAQAVVVAQVAHDARVAFYGALAADQLVAVAGESVATQERHLGQTEGFVRAGSRTRVDLAQGRADLAAAQLQRARAEAQRAAARAQLCAALGLERWREIELVPPEGAEGPPDGTAEEALRRRPEPRQLAAQARALREQTKALRGGFFPTLSLGLGPTFAGAALDALTTNFQVSLLLGYPTTGVNPMLVEAQQREARAGAAALDEQGRVARNGIRLELEQARAMLSSMRAARQAARQLVEAARERRDLADARFAAGLGTMIEISDAESAFVNARAQAIQVELDLGLARARFDKALGAPAP